MTEEKSLLYCETLNNFLKSLMANIRDQTENTQKENDKLRLQIKKLKDQMK